MQNSTDISLIELNDKTNDERKDSAKANDERRKGKDDNGNDNDGDGDRDDADNVVDKDKQCDNSNNNSYNSNKLCGTTTSSAPALGHFFGICRQH